ncbi:hypothetical protein [Vulgatibacter sp.]|uniref:hypothetical protein n=1 Tax=Vulgatibacter sp. TaxID=1971226 RepID=UPI003565E6C4
MDRISQLVARPGWLLRGASLFGLVAWLGIFAMLFTVPGITAGTYFSALAMAGLFGLLLAGQQAAVIRIDREGLSGRTLFRRLRCNWKAVQRVEARPFFPGLTIFLIATNRGPLVFTSLWRNHGELLAILRERAQLA